MGEITLPQSRRYLWLCAADGGNCLLHSAATIIAKEGRESLLAQAVGRDGKVSSLPCSISRHSARVCQSMDRRWLYVFAALLWLILIPESRERLRSAKSKRKAEMEFPCKGATLYDDPLENSIAFGAPGIEPRWTSSAKKAWGHPITPVAAFGSRSVTASSTEIYYPHVDQPTRETFSFSSAMENVCQRKSATLPMRSITRNAIASFTA